MLLVPDLGRPDVVGGGEEPLTISGRFGVWQLLVLMTPAIAAIQLLPFALRVQPAQLGRRATGFAGARAVLRPRG